MNDDRMDELLRREARDYNEPGPVPREAMWARIQEARVRPAEGTPTSAPAPGPRSVPSSTRPSRGRIWVWPALGVAAALLVTTGIVIGHYLDRTGPAPASTVATGSSPTVSPASDSLARHSVVAAPPVGGDSRGAEQSRSADLAYRLVMLQHLAGSEAMITSFRASARQGKPDTLMTAWSRELLGTTRLLAASPAADDPITKRLLQDLDFVISEIVQYSAHGVNNPDELDLIERSIDQRGVLSRLRGTIPGRSSSAGT